MSNRKIKSRMGWFGWSLIIAITVVTICSVLLFSNILKLNMNMLFSNDKKDAVTSKITSDHVKEVQETVGEDYQDIGVFVSDMHEFYNRTTGYGGIDSLDWKEQIDQAEIINTAIKDKLATTENETLRRDLVEIQNLVTEVINKESISIIQHLHRMFHDLDIALNSYNGYDKIWNVTETLKIED